MAMDLPTLSLAARIGLWWVAADLKGIHGGSHMELSPENLTSGCGRMLKNVSKRCIYLVLSRMRLSEQLNIAYINYKSKITKWGEWFLPAMRRISTIPLEGSVSQQE